MNEKQLTVCHVITDHQIGGAGKSLLNFLLAARSRQGRFAYTVAAPLGSPTANMLKKTGVEVIEISDISDASYSPKANRELYKLFSERKFDIVHTHASLTARLAAKKAKIPILILTRHCSGLPDKIEQTNFLSSLLLPLAGHFMSRTCNYAIAADESAAETLREMHFPSKRIRVVENGAFSLRSVPEAERLQLKKELGFEKNDFIVGIFARLEGSKSHRVFLKAASICKLTTQNIKFVIAGEGSIRAELEQLAEALNVSDIVRFVGFVDDVSPLMSICSVNCNTSCKGEASSLSIIEGMSIGSVPVVTDCGGNASIVGKCGFVCPCDSPEAFAAALLKLFNSPELVASMSSSAVKRFDALFSARRFASRVESVYCEAVDALSKNK